MIRAVVVVRPEPGNAATMRRARAMGLEAVALPFFTVTPLAWTVPGGASHDALIVTSANAMRHGGGGLAALRHLPVIAVGEASGKAARAAGFGVVAVGGGDAAAAAALARAHGFVRPLHLAGRDRVAIPGVTSVTAYRSDPRVIRPADLAACDGRNVLLHSARSARRLRALADAVQRARIGVVCLSPAVAAAAGPGWRTVLTAAVPTDAALLATAAAACD